MSDLAVSPAMLAGARAVDEHFATTDGRMIPFESHNLFYRPEQAALLQGLRDKIEQTHIVWQQV